MDRSFSRDAVGTETGRIVELRRYALHPGARETLIELFDRELVETQEEVGMRVLGQFRDLDDPDSFVWLRSFSDMRSRKRALEAFYSGPVWKEHARAANATMIDSDNVLLLHPVSGLELGNERPAPGATASRSGLLAVTIYPLAEAVSRDFPAFFLRELEPVLRDAGISVLATYATEHSPNTFPALPVRDDEDVFVWMAIFADDADRARHAVRLEASPAWQRTSAALRQHLHGQAEVLRLTPTARSALHG
jgi:quinol monooxygenase YgiN